MKIGGKVPERVVVPAIRSFGAMRPRLMLDDENVRVYIVEADASSIIGPAPFVARNECVIGLAGTRVITYTDGKRELVIRHPVGDICFTRDLPAWATERVGVTLAEPVAWVCLTLKKFQPEHAVLVRGEKFSWHATDGDTLAVAIEGSLRIDGETVEAPVSIMLPAGKRALPTIASADAVVIVLYGSAK